VEELYQSLGGVDPRGVKRPTGLLLQPEKTPSALSQRTPSATGRSTTSSIATANIDVGRVVEGIKEHTAKRGVNGILTLGRLFRHIDVDNSRKIDIKEFATALLEFRVQLKDKEIIELFQALDLDLDGFISYDEFLLAIRGPMKDSRRKLVQDIFKKLDKDNSGFVTMDELQKCFDAGKHPDVERRARKHDDVFEEFVDGLNGYYNIKGFLDGKVSEEEFLEFYSFISSGITDDQQFKRIVEGTWSGATTRPGARGGDVRASANNFGASSEYSPASKIGNTPANLKKNNYFSTGGEGSPSSPYNPQYGTTPRQNQPLGQDPLQSPTNNGGMGSPPGAVSKLLAQLTKKGPRTFINLRRQFRIMDDNNDGCISYPEFVKCLKDFGCNFSEGELKELFQRVDKMGAQKMNIDEFCREYVGEMSSSRRALVDEIFSRLDTNHDGLVGLNDVKLNFTARGHPDVRSGAKTQDEVLGDFINTIEAHMNLRSSKKDQRFTLEDFREYYNYVSMCYDDDTKFETMLRSCYRILSQETQPICKPI